MDRLIFIVALLGILTTVHLKIQQDRGFDRGCMGFTTSEAVEATFNCEAVTNSSQGQIFGISNAILGLLFYLGVAGLSMGIAYAKGGTLRSLKLTRALLIVVGFAYSVYLSYVQYFVLEDLCALCLISASLAGLLFVLQAIEYTKSPAAPIDEASSNVLREVGLYGALAVLVIMLAGADLAYFKSLGNPRDIDYTGTVDETVATPPAQPIAETRPGEVTSPASDVDTTGAQEAPPGACNYNEEFSPIEDYASLVDVRDPTKGTPNAPVVVMEYFDPLCPHCRNLHPIMQEAAEQNKDQALFVYRPVAVVAQGSVMMVATLHAAHQNGKFFEMLDLIFSTPAGQSYSLPLLRDYATQIGMSPDALEQRLRSGIYGSTMQNDREEFVNNGFSSVPTLLINGRVVEGESRSVDCLTQLIEEAAE